MIDRHAKAAAAILALVGLAAADAPRVTGYVTGTCSKDFNYPASGTSSDYNYYEGKEASFQLNAAHATFTGNDVGGANYVIDVDAGTDALKNPGSLSLGSGYAIDLQQAYVAVPFGKTPLGIQAGRFYTSEGIEVQNSGFNPTITRGLLFGQMECINHTGAILTADFGKHLNLAAGAVNGWNNWTVPSVDGLPMAYARIYASAGDPLSATLSGYYGSSASLNGSRDDFLSLDLTGISRLTSTLDLNFQGNYQFRGAGAPELDTKLSGAGIQPLLHLDNAQLGFRYELFYKDLKGKEVTINSLSLAPGFRFTASTLMRVEYRVDIGAEKDFQADSHKNRADQVVTVELNHMF